MQKQIPNQMFGFKCLRALPDPGAVGDHVVVKDHGEATIKTISEDGKKISVKFGDEVTTVVAAKKIRQSISGLWPSYLILRSRIRQVQNSIKKMSKHCTGSGIQGN